jgi:galactose oxidase
MTNSKFYELALIFCFLLSCSILLVFRYSGLPQQTYLPGHATTNFSAIGRWEASVEASLVPVAAALLPLSGHVVMWAADVGDVFEKADGDNWDSTVTAVYNPETRRVSDAKVSITNHGMFCPGLSLNQMGRVVVTGGHTSARTSVYEEERDDWITKSNMTVGRGYHSQVTLSTGNIFTIGGSWSGGVGGEEVGLKNGELWDMHTKIWHPLPGCEVQPMLTEAIVGGRFTSDNHGWLFAWKNGSVFQAGPSIAMNWYGTAGDGVSTPAGARSGDGDAMNGNAVMYDAISGKILTVGGAPEYTSSPSTKAAHIITLNDTFTEALIEDIESMKYARAYANSVVLPSGEVFVNGGASWAQQWTDVNSSWYPELWNPATKQFSVLARMSIPRNYHSVALLLPDATILTGGGGLCWAACQDLSVNHPNVQVFTPPYLFETDGKALAERPNITSVSETTISLGVDESIVTITTDIEVASFALVRYASSTHSINTDQRRIPLIPIPVSSSSRALPSAKAFHYQTSIPTDPGITVPGYWMLFAINNRGVPSIATTLHIKLPQD